MTNKSQTTPSASVSGLKAAHLEARKAIREATTVTAVRAAIRRVEDTARALEEAPIITDGVDVASYGMGVLYFVLGPDGWYPSYNAEENEETGWATLGIRYVGGAVDTCCAGPGEWAHCTADGQPNIADVWE